MDTAVYDNLEAVVEREDIVDPFRQVTLFKTNPSTLGAAAEAALRRIQVVPGFRRQFFRFYPNGKSAARIAPGLRAEGVHYFNYGQRPFRRVILECPAILHYAICGFSAFWQKYRTLGDFDDKWFGQSEIREQIGPFHLDARDVVAKNDESLARHFYRERVLFQDPALGEERIGAGLLQRITAPSERLQQLD